MYKKVKNPWIGKEGYNCFACSPDNPIGLHMQFYIDDNESLIATWTPSRNYESWTNVVHGGIQSLMIDEACGWWVSYFRQLAGVTSRMEVKFLKPVHSTEGGLKVRVNHIKDMRNYVVLHAELLNAKDEICTTADSVFYQYGKEASEEQFNFSGCVLEDGEMENLPL